MLIRKIALLAPAFASIFGVSQVEAGCFGKRNCCQATPIVCPPCAPAPYFKPAPSVVHSAPVANYSYSPCNLGYSVESCCGGSSVASVTVMDAYSNISESPTLLQIQNRVDQIDAKVDLLLKKP